MKIEELIWDSNFFGIKIGKIIINDIENFNTKIFKNIAKTEKYKLVYIFTYSQLLPWSKVLSSDIELVDIILTMGMKFDREKYKNNKYKLYTNVNLTKSRLIESYKIVEEISKVSRFYKEKTIGPTKTKVLYRKWLDNALNNTYADGLLLEKREDSIVGIHIIKTDKKNKIGHCSVIGVSPLFKGQGIGKSLWKQAFSYWARKNVEYCKVPFSIQNNQSFNFHLKLGFNKVDEIKYIYHFRNKEL